MPTKVFKFLGCPGTGKTTHALNRVEELLGQGVQPTEIGYYGFATRTIREVKERAVKKFPQFSIEKDFPYFRTLHSFSYRQIGMAGRNNVMRERDYAKICEDQGLEMKQDMANEDFENLDFFHYGHKEGDVCRKIYDLSRHRMIPLMRAWKDATDTIAWDTVERFVADLKSYKSVNFKVDFTDMLERFLREGPFPVLKYAFFDEAQDMSKIQFEIASKIIEKCECEAYVYGDDDQAIFGWAGVDPDNFIHFPGEVIHLTQSYRLPKKIHAFAGKQRDNITGSIPKNFSPRDEEGDIFWYDFVDQVDLSTGQWLVLARNVYQLKELTQMCYEKAYSFRSPLKDLRAHVLPAILAWEKLLKAQTIPVNDARTIYGLMDTDIGYKWGAKSALERHKQPVHFNTLVKDFGLMVQTPWYDALTRLDPKDISYIKSARAKGEILLGPPRIEISTIHRAKGGEADNVLLLTDVSRRTREQMDESPIFENEEHRVFYVATTRTKKNLHIVTPRTKFYYDL